MADFELQLLLIMTVTSTLLAVGCAVVAYRTVSASTRSRKQPPSPPPTPSSDGLPSVRAELAELSSAVESLATTVKRLSSRQGMADLRARRKDEQQSAQPPVGAPKAELYRHFGLLGKAGPAFARRQMDIETEINRQEEPN